MDKIKYSIVLLAGLLTLAGCNDSFLYQTPETDITEKNFFKTDADLQLYSNKFYDYFLNRPSHWATVSATMLSVATPPTESTF